MKLIHATDGRQVMHKTPCRCPICNEAMADMLRHPLRPFPQDPRVRTSEGIPDGYATALAARGITTPAVVLTNGIPDGYAAALPTPFTPGPDYHPFGQPLDGYQIALKRRREGR